MGLIFDSEVPSSSIRMERVISLATQLAIRESAGLSTPWIKPSLNRRRTRIRPHSDFQEIVPPYLGRLISHLIHDLIEDEHEYDYSGLEPILNLGNSHPKYPACGKS